MWKVNKKTYILIRFHGYYLICGWLFMPFLCYINDLWHLQLSNPFKPVISFPLWKYFRHYLLQLIPLYKISTQITSSQKPSSNFCHQTNTSNPNLPSHFIHTDFCINSKSVQCNTVCEWDIQWEISVQILVVATELSPLQTSRPT
jgi:hypothetical protein